MQEYVFEVTDSPTADELNVLVDGKIKHSYLHVEKFPRRVFGIFVRNTEEKIVAGIEGLIVYGWLSVKNLWVSEPIQNHGIGRQLMLQAEDKAKACGCSCARLETLDFQAKAFYEKLGYTVFAMLDDFPPGHQAFFMRKRLQKL